MITSIIGSVIIGLIVGALARFIMPGRDPMGCFMTAALGIGGSLLGGLIGSLIWPVRNDSAYMEPHRIRHFVLALIGALILLWLWRMFSRRRT